jgi:4-amino-4-deoxy-L-arabinose transferase-like glycosyltransferase
MFTLGILVRIVTYCFLAPENNDLHGRVLQFLVDHHALPLVWQEHEAHNPPLYYLLAAPILAWTGSMKMVQLLSLVFSCTTLWVLFRLIQDGGLIENASARLYALLLICFLPQFVMFSLYVSSDALAILLGACLALQTWRYIRRPCWKELLLLAVTLSLGLLTKTVFVVAAPILLALVAWYPRTRRHGWTGLLRADVFLILSLILGGYKFADNAVRYHDPFFNNMDLQDDDWRIAHRQTYRGIASLVDVNLERLLISPFMSPVTDGSYPVMLYGTFWFQHIRESNFIRLGFEKVRYLAWGIFVLALIPSLVFFTGLGGLARDLPGLLRKFDGARAEDLRALMRSTQAMILCLGILMLWITAWRYQEFSAMQGRLLFPWMFGGAVVFSRGVPKGDRGIAARGVRIAIFGLIALFLIYLASEMGALVWKR